MRGSQLRLQEAILEIHGLQALDLEVLLLEAALSVHHFALDGSKAIRELGLPQTPLEEAIQRALAWFKAQGYL